MSMKQFSEDGTVLTVGLVGMVAALSLAPVLMAPKGRSGSRAKPHYRLVQMSGKKWGIYGSPSNVILASGSKSKMQKLIAELRAMDR